MTLLDDASDPIMDVEEILETVAALGDPELFELTYAVYAAEVDGRTLEEIAADVGRPVAAVEADVEALVDGGVLAERMACLIGDDCDGEQYEVTEFGRLALEEGVLALFEAAGAIGELSEL